MIAQLASFFTALGQLLFLSHRISEKDTAAFSLVFALACAILSIGFILLDRGHKALRGFSLFSIDYDGIKFFFIVISWIFIVFFTGFLALSLEVLQPTFAACVAVSVSWPLVLTIITGVQFSAPSSGTDDEVEDGE